MDKALKILSILIMIAFAVSVVPMIGSFTAVGALVLSIIGLIYILSVYYRFYKVSDLTSYKKIIIFIVCLIVLAGLSIIPLFGSLFAVMGLILSIIILKKAKQIQAFSQTIQDKPVYDKQVQGLKNYKKINKKLTLPLLLLFVLFLGGGIAFNYVRILAYVCWGLFVLDFGWFIYVITRLRIEQAKGAIDFGSRLIKKK